MPFLAAALLALSAPSPAAPFARTVSEEEMYCVFDTLDEALLTRLAGLVLLSGDGAAAEMMKVAAPAADTCAAKWKWTAKGRAAGSILAAAQAGRLTYRDQLKARFTEDRLIALFQKLDEMDQAAFTFDRTAALTAAEGAALQQRVEALFAREGVAKSDYEPIVFYFMCAARGAETEAYWLEMGRKDER